MGRRALLAEQDERADQIDRAGHVDGRLGDVAELRLLPDPRAARRALRRVAAVARLLATLELAQEELAAPLLAGSGRLRMVVRAALVLSVAWNVVALVRLAANFESLVVTPVW